MLATGRDRLMREAAAGGLRGLVEWLADRYAPLRVDGR
jgi:hypothetical protein